MEVNLGGLCNDVSTPNPHWTDAGLDPRTVSEAIHADRGDNDRATEDVNLEILAKDFGGYEKVRSNSQILLAYPLIIRRL